jgi:hypothetical protein
MLSRSVVRRGSTSTQVSDRDDIILYTIWNIDFLYYKCCATCLSQQSHSNDCSSFTGSSQSSIAIIDAGAQLASSHSDRRTRTLVHISYPNPISTSHPIAHLVIQITTRRCQWYHRCQRVNITLHYCSKHTPSYKYPLVTPRSLSHTDINFVFHS